MPGHHTRRMRAFAVTALLAMALLTWIGSKQHRIRTEFVAMRAAAPAIPLFRKMVYTAISSGSTTMRKRTGDVRGI